MSRPPGHRRIELEAEANYCKAQIMMPQSSLEFMTKHVCSAENVKASSLLENSESSPGSCCFNSSEENSLQDIVNGFIGHDYDSQHPCSSIFFVSGCNAD